MTDAILPHIQFAREVLAGPTSDLPTPFVRRAELASLPAIPTDSAIETPAFLIDIGLRQWRDPARLWSLSLARSAPLARRWGELAAGLEQGLVLVAREWETGEIEAAAVLAALESLVVFTGDDAAAAQLADLLDASVRPVRHPRLAVAMATVKSLDAPERSAALLKAAAGCATTPLSRFLIALRSAALLVKRLRDYPAARAQLAELAEVAEAARRDYLFSAADAATMRALTLNLGALVDVREDQPETARATMEEAAALMPDDGFVIVPGEMADRYRAQVRVNLVQALWLAGNASEAIRRANTHVVLTRSEHPYSLSEALLVAAYFNFLGGEHAMALSFCMEAERLVAAEGAPTRLAMCRKIAVGALDGLGKTRRAAILAKQLFKDPLGDHRLV